MRAWMIALGNFLFKHRNHVFPLYILALFLAFGPPAHTLRGSVQWDDLQDGIALGLAVAGLALRGFVIGLAYIKRGGRGKKVYADNLVTEGMFSVCRNPLYVGNMLICLGEFLMFGSYACLVVGMLSFWFFYECIIAAEENFLGHKFGVGYEAYCRDVPRWRLRIGKIPAAAAGMTFDWKKVIFKDYSTMASTFAILIGIQLWERQASTGLHWADGIVQLELALLGSILVGTLIIVAIKKTTARAKAARKSS